MKTRLGRTLIAAAAVLAIGGRAYADPVYEEIQTFPNVTAGNDFLEYFHYSGYLFDPSLGTLTGASFEYDGITSPNFSVRATDTPLPTTISFYPTISYLGTFSLPLEVLPITYSTQGPYPYPFAGNVILDEPASLCRLVA